MFTCVADNNKWDKTIEFHFVIELLVILGRWELRCNQHIIDYMFILEMIFPFRYFTHHDTNLNSNIISFRFYRRLLRVYIFFISGWSPLRLRCVDLTPYCRHFMISTMAIEWKGHFPKKLLPNNEKSMEQTMKFYVKSEENTTDR